MLCSYALTKNFRHNRGNKWFHTLIIRLDGLKGWFHFILYSSIYKFSTYLAHHVAQLLSFGFGLKLCTVPLVALMNSCSLIIIYWNETVLLSVCTKPKELALMLKDISVRLHGNEENTRVTGCQRCFWLLLFLLW